MLVICSKKARSLFCEEAKVADEIQIMQTTSTRSVPWSFSVKGSEIDIEKECYRRE